MEHPSYCPEIARTTFLKSVLKVVQENITKAKQARNVAANMREKLSGVSVIARDHLQESDFDEVVTFWSR